MKPAGAACASCPAQHATCVPPEPARRRVQLAIVGEGPGNHELDALRPFVGASGRMLVRELRKHGLDRGDVHWTNAILCECPPEAQAKAAKACRVRLQQELAAVGAPVVMPVGAWGLQGALGTAKKPQILKWRGSVNPYAYGSVAKPADAAVTSSPIEGSNPSASTSDAAAIEKGSVVMTGNPVSPKDPQDYGPVEAVRPAAAASLVCPTVHPAFVMRAEAWRPVFELDVARVARVLRQGFTAPEDAPGRRLVVARTRKSLTHALAQLQPGAAVSADVETVGLGPTQTALVCFGLSDGTTTVVVPWARASNGIEPWWPFEADVAHEVSRALAGRIVVTHNGPAFDHIVFKRYGIEVEVQWDDTLLMTHALRGHLRKNLALVVTTCGAGALDVPAWKEWEDRNATLERLWVYNGRDCLYTILAYHELVRELREAAA